MRNLETLPGTFDAVLCLWQSFGYFDSVDVLRQMRDNLKPPSRQEDNLNARGRLMCDSYSRDFFAAHRGSAIAEREGRTITTSHTLRGGRLTAHIQYGAREASDIFEW